MKTCIWCKKKEGTVTFIKKAHIVPQSLGGKLLCDEVCDSCNAFFGNHLSGKQQIEVVVKEIFYLSWIIFLEKEKQVGRNKLLDRPKSTFFKIDVDKRKIKIKQQLLLQEGFKKQLCHQFKRGLFKMFLENQHRKNKDGHEEKYDFIREFAYSNFGDFPVIYHRRNVGILYATRDEVLKPAITETNNTDFVLDNFNFYEFEILSHRFAIPLNRMYDFTMQEYLNYSKLNEDSFLFEPVMLSDVRQIDLTLSVLTGNK